MESYTIHDILLNDSVSVMNPSNGTFDVLVEWEYVKKWLSIPYDLFFNWVFTEDVSLQNYINSHMPQSKWEHVIIHLDELNYDWKQYLLQYIDNFYPKNMYESYDTYNPKEFN